MDAKRRAGLIGARGYAGAEVIKILERHPEMELALATSRAHAGKRLDEVVPEYAGELSFIESDPSEVAEQALEVYILALPNGLAEPYVQAIERHAPSSLILDLSADYRFDENWVYSIPELDRASLDGARRIANPGCYATAAQLALEPLADHLVSAPRVFGVSGYSGAGTTPSPKNDPERLKDNLLPYKLNGHGHEAEMRRRVGGDVRFMPHVAAFFRGISLTIDLELDVSAEHALALLNERYACSQYVEVRNAIPEIAEVANSPNCIIGGEVASAGQGRFALISVIDNLLKGAASQAVQNVNLAMGWEEHLGLGL